MDRKDDPFIKSVEQCLESAGHSVEEGQLFKITSLMELKKAVDKRGGLDLSKVNSIEGLTPKQLQVLKIWCQGYTYKQTASKLHRTENTIRSHVRQIYAKLGVENKIACVDRAKELGLVP